MPALCKAKKSHSFLEGILKDFAHAIDLAVVEDIAGFLEELDDDELEECFASVPWSNLKPSDTKSVSKFIADAIRAVWVGCNISDIRVEKILKASYPHFKAGVDTLTPHKLRSVFCKLREVCKKRVTGNHGSLMILCCYAMRKYAKIQRETASQNMLNTFLGMNTSKSPENDLEVKNEEKNDKRDEISNEALLSGMHKLKAAKLMRELLSEASDLEKVGALRVKQPTWDGKSTVEREALQRLGFLFSMYKCEFWYWEAWETFRKLLLSSVLLFVWDGTAGQVCAGFLIATWSLILALNWQPHSVRELQATYSYSLLVEAVTHLSGLMLITSGFQDMVGTDDRNDKFILGVVLIILHVASFLIPVMLHTWLHVFPHVHLLWPQWLTCCQSSHQDTSWRYAYEEDQSQDLSQRSQSLVHGDIGFDYKESKMGQPFVLDVSSMQAATHTAAAAAAAAATTQDRQIDVKGYLETEIRPFAMGAQEISSRPTANGKLPRLTALKLLKGNKSPEQVALANFTAAPRQKKDATVSIFDEDSPLVFC